MIKEEEVLFVLFSSPLDKECPLLPSCGKYLLMQNGVVNYPPLLADCDILQSSKNMSRPFYCSKLWPGKKDLV